jgi:tryptophan synthase alpha chain
MTTAIGRKFEALKRRGGRAFIPFITAGDPDLETTVRLAPELERAGAHILELGIPFSDPVADGPVIQRASERALKHGYRISDYIEAVARVRRESAIPILLFSYYNPLLQYGLQRLAGDGRRSGVDGLLVTDMTPEESGAYRETIRGAGLDTVFLAAPTSDDERIGRIVEVSSGFVYVVSRTGVTGAKESLSSSVGGTVDRVRARTSLPIAVGFGISSPEQVREVCRVADGAVVGSAIVKEIERCAGQGDVVARVADYCRWLAAGAV